MYEKLPYKMDAKTSSLFLSLFLHLSIYLVVFFYISTSFNVAESLETFLMVEAPAAVLPPPQFATKR